MTPGRISRLAALTLFALALGGCGSSPKTSFYTLGAASVPPESVAAQASYRVAVGPVTVPDMVDRPQLVVRVAANQVTLLDQHHWAEPLRSEIPRVLAADLARSLGTAQVSAYPRNGGEADYRVRVDIQDFDSVPGEGVRLNALWSVQRGVAGENRLGRSAIRVPANGAGYEALVAAHGTALARMSQDIAGIIQAMQSQPK